MHEDLESSPYLGWVIELQLVPLTSGVLVDPPDLQAAAQPLRGHVWDSVIHLQVRSCPSLQTLPVSCLRLTVRNRSIVPIAHPSARCDEWATCTAPEVGFEGRIQQSPRVRPPWSNRPLGKPPEVSSVLGGFIKESGIRFLEIPWWKSSIRPYGKGRKTKGARYRSGPGPLLQLFIFLAMMPRSACSVCRRASQQCSCSPGTAGGIWFGCQHGN